MKPRLLSAARLSFPLATSIAALLAAPTAQAAIYYWDTDGSGTPGFGTASGIWGTSAFWGTDAAGSGATANTTITTADTVNFGTGTAGGGLAAGTVGVTGTVNVNKITFGSLSGTIVLSGGTQITLGGTSPTITVNNAQDTISTKIVNTTNNATSGLTKAGTGELILSGSGNSFAGDANTGNNVGVRISAGTLTVSGGSLATATASKGIGTFSGDAGNFNQTGTSTVTAAGDLIVGWNSNSTFTLSGGTTSATNIRHQDAGDGVITISGTNSTTANTVLHTTGGGGADSLTVNLNTGGTLTTSRMYVNAGTATTGSHALNINLNGGTLKASATGNLIDNPTGTNAANASVNATVKLSGAFFNSNGFTATILRPLLHDSGLGATLDGGLTLNDTAAIKGSLVLTGPNTYTGATTISAGTLRFAKQVSLYNNSTASWTAANIKVANTGTLALNVGGTGEFTTGDVTTLLTNLGGANGTSTAGFAAGSSIAFDTTTASGSTFTVADTIADSTGTGGGALGVTKLGTNTLVLSGPNTYTGNTTLSAGTLNLGVAETGINGPLGVGGTINFNGGALQYSASNNTDYSGRFSTAASQAYNADTNNQSVTWATALTSSGGTLTKTGLGTLTLTHGSNTYNGATTVSAGTLQFNGSLTGAGAAVSVSGTGTLGVGSSATIARNVNLSSGAVDLAGTLAGTLTVTGGTVTTSGSSPTVTTADFSAGTGTVAASTPLTITNQLKLTGGTTATLSGGTSFTATGANLVNNSTARTLTVAGGTLTLAVQNVGTPIASGITATASSSYTADGRTPIRTVDLSGMSGTFPNGTAGNVPANAMWLSNNTTGAGTFISWDLGASYTLSQIRVWNYNEVNLPGRGVKSLTLQTSTNGTTWTNAIAAVDWTNIGANGTITGTVQGTGAAGYGGFDWTLPSTLTTRYIRFNDTRSFAAPTGLVGYTGLSEVAFFQPGSTAVNLPNTSIAATASSVLDLASSSGTHTLASLNLTAGATTTALSLKNGSTLTLNGDANNNAISATGTAGQTASILPDATSPPSLIIASGKNVSVDPGVTLTVQSVISGGAVSKIGGGTLTLTNTNTYSGNTAVNAGKLIIASSGSTHASSAVTVSNAGSELVVNGTVNGTLVANSSTTISGTGTIAGNATIQGIHNPGNSPGIQTYGSNLTYSGGSSVVNWELVGNTSTNAANPNAIFDQIIVGGDLNFVDSTGLNLSFNAAGSNVLWSDTSWDSSQSWTLYDVAGTNTNFSNLSLTTVNWLDSGSNLFSTTGGSFSLGQSGQDVVLNYVIPEPRAALLGALGLLALLRRRRG